MAVGYKVATLDRLINLIKDKISFNTLRIENINSVINHAGFGDLSSKIMLKNAIKKYLNDFNLENINLLIYGKTNIQIDDKIKNVQSGYYINYFEPIYRGNNKIFIDIINKPCIDITSGLDSKIDLLCQIIYQELFGLSIIDSYSYNNIPGINEININTKDFISFQIKGIKEHIPRLFFKNQSNYEAIVARSVAFEKIQHLDENNPEVLCDNLSNTRITAVRPPYSRYFSLNLRYTGADLFSKKSLITSGTSNEAMESFIDLIINGRPNIFVLGGQSTGKTTYLFRIISSISDNVSLLTIESTMELDILKHFPNKDVKNLKFYNKKSPQDCFKTSLRMGRDIIIDGEVRSPEEAYITLQAMTRQNRGSMGTFHTSSNEDFMYDYKNILLQGGLYKNDESALYDISRAVDLLIFISIDRSTGKRYIKKVSEVIFKPENYRKPYELSTLFEYDRKIRALTAKNRLSAEFIEKALDYEFTEEHLEKLNSLYKKLKI